MWFSPLALCSAGRFGCGAWQRVGSLRIVCVVAQQAQHYRRNSSFLYVLLDIASELVRRHYGSEFCCCYSGATYAMTCTVHSTHAPRSRLFLSNYNVMFICWSIFRIMNTLQVVRSGSFWSGGCCCPLVHREVMHQVRPHRGEGPEILLSPGTALESESVCVCVCV